MKPFNILAVVQPGLEPFAQLEIETLGYHDLELIRGGIFLKGHLSTVIKLNLACRTISRVLINASEFEAKSFFQLEQHFAQIPWLDYLGSQKVCIRVSSFQSTLYHEKAISERLIASLAQFLGKTVTVVGSPDEENTQLIVVHVKHDVFTIRMDSSGSHLHKRGYGTFKEAAPLRETIACAMLMATGWNETVFDLCDPMCGSGTIPIEAALMAKKMPLSEFRSFAFQLWPSCQPEVFDKVRKELLSGVIEKPEINILASDLSAKAIQSTTNNARTAGVENLIRINTSPLHEINIDKIYSVVTNPPWGKRIGDSTIKLIWQDLQKMTKKGVQVYCTLPEWQEAEFPCSFTLLFSFAAGNNRIKFIKVMG